MKKKGWKYHKMMIKMSNARLFQENKHVLSTTDSIPVKKSNLFFRFCGHGNANQGAVIWGMGRLPTHEWELERTHRCGLSHIPQIIANYQHKTLALVLSKTRHSRGEPWPAATAPSKPSLPSAVCPYHERVSVLHAAFGDFYCLDEGLAWKVTWICLFL